MGSDYHLDPPPRDYGHNAELYMVSTENEALLVAVERSRTTGAIKKFISTYSEGAWKDAYFEFIDSFSTERKTPFVLIQGEFLAHYKDHSERKWIYPKLKEELEQLDVPILEHQQTRTVVKGDYWMANDHRIVIYVQHQELLMNRLAAFRLEVRKVGELPKNRLRLHLRELF